MASHGRIPVIRAVLLAAITAVAALPDARPANAADMHSQAARAENDNTDVVMGVGLVVGLPGTGDSEVDDALVENSIVGVLLRTGLDVWHDQIRPGRVAKVVVSAELSPNPSAGAHLVVSITAIGNAVSLAGGTLLPTPLRDPNGEVYAVGQGKIEIAGRMASVSDQSAQSRVKARSGSIANGAEVVQQHLPVLASE